MTTQHTLGPVAVAHQGPYNPARPYTILQEVQHEGSSYRAAADVPAGIAPGVDARWILVSKKGDDGGGSDALVGENLLINGDTSQWQRGSSFFELSTNTYTADRWGVFSSYPSAIYSVPAPAPCPVPTPYAMQIILDGATQNIVAQPLENYLALQTRGSYTFSFYARSKIIPLTIKFGIGDMTIPTNIGTAALTTTWKRFSHTVDNLSFGSTAPQRGVFLFTDVGTMGTVEVTGFMLNAGLSPTVFQPRPAGLERILCSRYYTTLGQGTLGSAVINGASPYNFIILVPLCVPLRAWPKPSVDTLGTVSVYGVGGYAALTEYTMNLNTTTGPLPTGSIALQLGPNPDIEKFPSRTVSSYYIGYQTIWSLDAEIY